MGRKELFDIQAVYLCQKELFEIELFSHISVCKQKLVFKKIAEGKQKTVYLCRNELFWIVAIELFLHLGV